MLGEDIINRNCHSYNRAVQFTTVPLTLQQIIHHSRLG